MSGKLAAGEIAVGEVVTEEIVLGKLCLENDLTPKILYLEIICFQRVDDEYHQHSILHYAFNVWWMVTKDSKIDWTSHCKESVYRERT